MVGGDHAVTVQVTGCGVLGIDQRRLVADDVQHDARILRRKCAGLGDFGITIATAAETFEPGTGQQRERRVRTARPLGSRILRTDRIGQRPDGCLRDRGVLGRHRRRDDSHTVPVVVDPQRPVVMGTFTPFPHRGRVTTEHDAIGQITNGPSRPHPLAGADRGGDIAVDLGGIILSVTQIRPGDDGGHLRPGEQPVAQTQRHLRQPIAQRDCLPQQCFCRSLGDRMSDRNTRGTLCIGVDSVEVVLGGRLHQRGVQRGSSLKGVPGQVGLPTLAMPQRQQHFGHRRVHESTGIRQPQRC